MFRKRKIAKTTEFNFIIVIRVIAFLKNNIVLLFPITIILSKTTHGSFKILSEIVFLVNMFCFRPKNRG